jgi:prepilin signal peptidase PulO-like enzyme (type II secretory pathway)
MDSFKDSVTFWTTLIGTLAGLLGAFRSDTWLTVIGAVVVAGSIGTVSYAKRQRDLLQSAALRVDGQSIDSLNLASLRRRLNRSLVIQQAENLAVIDGEDLTVQWKCAGYCRAEREAAIEFSIDADANIPFAELDCVAFDLRRDPRKEHGIRPMLVGPDGISKKIAVPFLSPLAAQEPFSVLLKCKLPRCMKTGIDYYTTTFSFDQATVPRYSARLRFLHGRPQWVRVYECRATGTVTLLKNLSPKSSGTGFGEYLDTDENVPAQSARIYVFLRELPVSATENSAATADAA